MVYVILVEPENPGNIGAICRVMANFGQKNLVLIKPKCDYKSEEARRRAKHAQDILNNAIVTDNSFFKEMDYLVGTTARLGTDYNIPRSPISAEKFAKKIKNKKCKIGILIGREGKGLSNKEIENCDYVVTIPSSKTYPTLNTSHATAIILYEIFKNSNEKKSNDHFIEATKIEKEIVLKRIYSILENISFSTKEKKETQKIVWKRLVGKSMLTKREAFALIGFFKKIEDKLKEK